MEELYSNKKWLILLNSFFEFIYLNLLWLLFSLPLITFWPATAAMFGVVRKWINGEETEIFSTYKKLFVENFYSSLITGVIWSAFSFVLLANLFFINRFSTGGSLTGLFLFGIAAAFFAMVSVHLLPVMVHLNTNWLGIWRNAFQIALFHPFRSFANIGIACACLYLLVQFPLFVLGTGSIGAYFIYISNHRMFEQWKTEA